MRARPIQDGEESAAAAALAAAFQRDDVAAWLFANPDTRAAQLGALFDHLVASRGPTTVVEVTDDLSAAAIWQPPGAELAHPPPPGAPTPADDLFRDVYDRVPEGPFRYLAFLGARTPGIGAGAALLSSGFEQFAGERLALWTGSARNVAFYEAHGFCVVDRIDAPGLSVWWMTRG